MLRTRTRRYEVLALLLLAGGLAVSAIVWQANIRTTGGTTGGGDVYTHAENPAACIAQASAFTNYPLVFAGPSVLGYPLTSCAHMMTKTRHAPDGRVSHPGGDAWHFGYGDCTIPVGRDSCAIPISIVIDPCSNIVDGRIIPKGSQPVRSMTVRGSQADIYQDGVLTFEKSPQLITIYAPEGPAAERVTNAVAIAEALIPANALASALSRGAPLTAAFAAATDTLCASSAAATTATATPAPPPAGGAPSAPACPGTDSGAALCVTDGAASVGGNVTVSVHLYQVPAPGQTGYAFDVEYPAGLTLVSAGTTAACIDSEGGIPPSAGLGAGPHDYAAGCSNIPSPGTARADCGGATGCTLATAVFTCSAAGVYTLDITRHRSAAYADNTGTLTAIAVANVHNGTVTCT